MRQPALSIIVPVRDDAIRLSRCLSSIACSAKGHAVEVIVVDNGSVDGSAELAARSGATVLSMPGVRVSEARNAGATRAKADLLAFIDADHELDPGWVSAALAIFSQASVSGAGAPYLTPPDANWIQRSYGRLRPRVVGQQSVDWLGSGNLIVRRTAFTAIKGFDTALESCEDVDLCNRLGSAGYRLFADERLRSVHWGDPRTLRAVFFGELWRGRDNIRVTLRGQLSLGALPSLLIPVFNLACICLLLGSPWLGVEVALAAVFGPILFAVLKAIKMSCRQASCTVMQLAQNVTISVVYDVARACALVFRATHRTRRETAGEERAVA